MKEKSLIYSNKRDSAITKIFVVVVWSYLIEGTQNNSYHSLRYGKTTAVMTLNSISSPDMINASSTLFPLSRFSTHQFKGTGQHQQLPEDTPGRHYIYILIDFRQWDFPFISSQCHLYHKTKWCLPIVWTIRSVAPPLCNDIQYIQIMKNIWFKCKFVPQFIKCNLNSK